MSASYDEIYYRFLNIPSGDLRISITNACNMKCVYCHNEGQKEDGGEFLSIEKIKYIVANAKRYGLTKVRLTGGDPLVHPQIIEICKEIKNNLNVHNLGINTNGYRGDLLIQICKERLLNQVVIGMDYFNERISKNSPIGPSSKEIKELILQLKEMGVNVQVAVVYSNNERDIFELVEWALNNKILLKVLEIENFYDRTFNPATFDRLIDRIKQHFGLKIGLTADLREKYLYNSSSKILFFQSHCNRRECQLCRNMHLRVDAKGFAKSCMFRSETYDLTSEEFDINIKRVLANIGKSPQDEIV